MIDCHLHLQDNKLYFQADEILDRIREVGVKALVVNGTEPGDWERVADLAERFPEVIPFFGVHPWKVNGVESDWADCLRGYLDRFPGSGVGEVGLDKWIRDHDIELQKEIFGEQLAMACELKRPVSVHCLQAWGHLTESLKQGMVGDPTLLSRTLLHSFGGPAEMVEEFVELGVYFSISGYFFRPDKSMKLEVFNQIPDDHLLIETDAPDMMPPASLQVDWCEPETNHPANIKLIYRAVADWKGEPTSDLISRTDSNFRAWCYADRA